MAEIRDRSRFARTAAIGLLAATMVATSPATLATAADEVTASVVVTEVMQNPSAVADGDGEWFEVTNTTDTAIDLAGWTIADNDIDSHVIATSVVVAPGGFAVLGNNSDPATNGGVTVDYDYGDSWFLANGADEVVLIDGGGTEVDRIEYDGGAVWPDPTGASMSLDPAQLANNHVGTNWCEATTAFGDGDLGTPGTTNPSCDEAAGSVVVTEVMQNPSAVFDNAGEWFEVTNTTDTAIDLAGWTIADNDSDSHVIATSVVVPAGGFAVLGNNPDPTTNGGVTVDYDYGGNWFLANGADEVVLIDGGGTEVDRIEYDGGPVWPDPNGASMSLDPAQLANNHVGTNWCEATTAFGDGDLGTPGATNPSCDGGSGGDGGGDGGVVITEVMQNPSAVFDNAGEWFEVTNTTDTAIDLAGWTIADNDSDSHVIATSVVVPAGGFAVLGNNPDPTTNGGVTVDYDYGDSWFLANGADEVVLIDGGGTEVDRIEYDGGPVWPDPNGASMSLDPAQLANNDDGTNWCEATTAFGDGDLGTPGATNPSCDGGSGGEPLEVAIHEVQGDGAASPLVGERVTIDGTVVGDYQQFGSFGGFHVQEPDTDADADPATSEGIFVFHFSTAVELGDTVRVTGTVTELARSDEPGSLTEITDATVEVVSSGNALPAPTAIEFPVTAVEALEAYEGMLAEFPQGLVVSEYFNFDRFGELVVALPAEGENRPFNPTAVFDPDDPAAAERASLNERSRITVDDAITAQNPEAPINPFNGELFSLENDFRGGDVVTGLTGPIHFDFGLYRVLPRPDGHDSYVATERPAAPAPVGGGLRLASLNALNYFLTLDDGNDVCGADENLECRGANDAEEFERQRTKLLNTLEGLDADIIGMNEVENRPGVEPLADLAAGLNERLGAGTYDFIAAGDDSVVGSDAIKVGILYRTDAVLPIGDVAVLDDPAFVNPRDADTDKNRAAVAASFVDRSTGGVVSVVVNHLKSKGSSCGPDDDGPLTGSCNLTRTLAAEFLADWVTTDPTGVDHGDWMILGDLNSYDKEDPIDVLTEAGYTDLQAQFGGEFAYSFVFDGQYGYLDYTMSSASLTPQVTGATEWHINADEPDVFDYDTTFKSDYQDGLFDPTTPFRSSDHDAALAGADLATDADVVVAWVRGEVDELEAAGSLNTGQANGLRRRLDHAQRQLDRGHVNGTIGILSGISSQLDDWVADGVLTADEADPLIAAIEAVISGLS